MAIIRPRLVCLIILKRFDDPWVAAKFWPWKVIFHISDRILKIGQIGHESTTLGNVSYFLTCSLTFQKSKILDLKNHFLYFRTNIKNWVLGQLWITRTRPICEIIHKQLTNRYFRIVFSVKVGWLIWVVYSVFERKSQIFQTHD